MNKMLIAVGIIFLVCMVIGYVRGFLRIVATLAATIATVLLVSILSPYVSNVLLETVPLESMAQEKCMKMLGVATEDGQFVIPEEAEHSREMQIELIENAEMPRVFRELLLENNNEEIYRALGVSTFSTYAGKYLAKLISDIISYLLALVVVTIIIRTILYMMGTIEKIPVIRGLNRLGGGVLGIGTGLIVVWVLFIVITLMYDTEIGKTCLENIMENKFLENLYNNNILMNYITKFRG